MTDAEIERRRIMNLTRIVARGLEACTREGREGDFELEILLTGPHGKAVALGILEFAPQTRLAVKRNARLWHPFGGVEHLLIDLISDRSRLGILRVKNLLEAGWNPNYSLPGTGRTALMQVMNNWTPENRTLVALLLAAGADTTKPSAAGTTVYDDAPTVMRDFIRSTLKDLRQDPTGKKCA
ncbi:MAG TPA: hypothetical protein VGH91_13725 [Gammaproteobacteria bacterium]|jgi:hypothetical protein